MTDNQIEIEIDGKTLKADPHLTVMQVADRAGIYIPRFCYHKHLSIAANCRMCLVEVEKSPKTLPACATPIMQGMKVFTTSQKTRDAQRAVMEFLLINHPLDCPICDQGGECELQDLSMGYGSGHSAYNESKRAASDLALGPLIATEMTRCIYCTRCVRFGDEIAGMRELGIIYRGEHSEIGTYVQEAIQSELSGNMIDLCPVGALTAKPYRFTARPWELDQAFSISPHDCIGSHLAIHTRYGKVMRVVARENNAINETWIADRDRFSYAGLYHPDRLKEPMVKVNGEWKIVDWEEALNFAAKGIQATIAEFGADHFGALASTQSTLEEFYLLQKLTRSLGSPHVDYRMREQDTRDQADENTYAGFQLPLSELENCDALLLIGSHLHKEEPLVALRVRKAALKGAAVTVINMMDYVFHFPVSAKKIAAPHYLIRELIEVEKALQTEDTTHPIAAAIIGKKKVCLLIGTQSLHHPDASIIRQLAHKIAALSHASINFLTDGANTAGGWLAGARPDRAAGGKPVNPIGLSAYEMLANPRKAYLLLNVEPDLDCANTGQAKKALQQAKFIAAISLYRNPLLDACANVILPMAAFTETSGTFVNAEGTWQSFNGAAIAFEASRPAWKILRALGNFLNLTGFDYEESTAIKHEVETAAHPEFSTVRPEEARSAVSKDRDDRIPVLRDGAKSAPPQDERNGILRVNGQNLSTLPSLTRIGEIPLYATDSLVRHALPLQEAQLIMEGNLAAVRLHPLTANRLNLQTGQLAKISQGEFTLTLPVILDNRVPEEAVFIAGAQKENAALGDLFGQINIEKAS